MIDEYETRTRGERLLERLAEATEGYGDAFSVSALGLVVRVRREETLTEPASGQTLILGDVGGAVSDETEVNRLYLLAMFEDAIELLRKPAVDLADLPSLD